MKPGEVARGQLVQVPCDEHPFGHRGVVESIAPSRTRATVTLADGSTVFAYVADLRRVQHG